ncbi:hypothetical protein RSK20926_13699 [Roseobacter sp. SK209-2-6]|uniref:hypothetical protein n=1 Tax=Roseobacter sp. SK209-2-6 TaxID=388739 RepID=UPI0000F3D50B|nr:hypothetical protein [Roseobacter sp. SK209-2-6]EBA15689.1 hypothetical protein RSK20926_13699 [Roseobacter sp. SK209-2-6]
MKSATPYLLPLLAAIYLCPTSMAWAERFSIVNDGFLRQGTATGQGALIQHRSASLLVPEAATPQAKASPELEAEMEAVQSQLASLFTGREGTSLFRALPKKVGQNAVQRLLHLIASAEAGKAQYDAVQYAARIRPSKRPTEMTIAEIYAWIDATPGQQHAIGRYQMIPATLRRLVKKTGARRSDRFSPALQDRLAQQLLEEAGLGAVLAGEIGRRDFMHNLAKIWAGLPTASGKSYYHGLAGNKAVLSWARFDQEMAQIFPS